MAILLIDLVRIASTLLSLLIIARAVLSWFSPDPGNAVVRLVHQVTEPVLAPVRNLLPAPGGMDFSPILVLIGVQVVEQVLVRLLVGMA
jgi:YggT family protein